MAQREASLEALAKLSPAFKEGGTITAGNASKISSGAAALVLMAAEMAREKGIRPMARVIAHGSAGKDFLTPWVLLVLRNWSMHGYQLMQTLTMFGLASFEPTTVYRTLRRLQKSGLIMSAWETGDSGPAKRVYSLTEAGEEFLRTWASALRQYQGLLDRFTEVYSQGQRPATKEDTRKSPLGKTEETR